MRVAVLLLFLVFSIVRAEDDPEDLTGDELIDYINGLDTTWTAVKYDKFSNMQDTVKWGMMGVNHVRLSVEGKKTLSETRLLTIEVPEAFDARVQWGAHCPSLLNIRDQSSCGSCWAFGAVEAMSDRICIASGGKEQVSLSADDLLSCCSECGFGCDGGEPLAAWQYWVKTGIVTGSNFTMHQGCKPYPFPPCEHHNNKTHFPACKHDLYPTPQCEHSCQSTYTTRSYNSDKYYGKNAYGVDSDVESIQKEIMTHGPVEVAFEVYEDFLAYAGGVYQHKGGKLGGGHAVKMLGWGEEDGTPYWIVANSWNTDWGEDGFFRIVRGHDECGIESGVVGGVPRTNQTRKRKIGRKTRKSRKHRAVPIRFVVQSFA